MAEQETLTLLVAGSIPVAPTLPFYLNKVLTGIVMTPERKAVREYLSQLDPKQVAGDSGLDEFRLKAELDRLSEPTFTISEIKEYIMSQDSLGDVAYNLSADSIENAL